MLYFNFILEIRSQIHEYEYDIKNKKGTFRCEQLNIKTTLYDTIGNNKMKICELFDEPNENIEYIDETYDKTLQARHIKNFFVIESKIDDEISNNLSAVIQKNVSNYYTANECDDKFDRVFFSQKVTAFLKN